jgi:LAO/AO transport system kinase
MNTEDKNPAELIEQVLAGNRRALARAITLIESTRPDHRATAEALLQDILPMRKPALRLGISGSPGVGKSTFIEAFGLHLIDAGEKVAVLAVDPSSKRTGGSILGDKTRMELLSKQADAYIRPTPSGGSLGGVARRTREAMHLVEAAGYSVVIVETVGVGQSETTVAEMVDMFILLLSPGGGDELQGIKRGIMELADLVVVNKADGDFVKAARHAASDYRSALHLVRPRVAEWVPEVQVVSAIENRGMDDVWQAAKRYQAAIQETGTFDARRARQATRWMWAEVEENLLTALKNDPEAGALAVKLEQDVADGAQSPAIAAKQILARFLKIS